MWINLPGFGDNIFVEEFHCSLKASKLHHGVRDLPHPERGKTFVEPVSENKYSQHIKNNFLNAKHLELFCCGVQIYQTYSTPLLSMWSNIVHTPSTEITATPQEVLTLHSQKGCSIMFHHVYNFLFTLQSSLLLRLSRASYMYRTTVCAKTPSWPSVSSQLQITIFIQLYYNQCVC